MLIPPRLPFVVLTLLLAATLAPTAAALGEVAWRAEGEAPHAVPGGNATVLVRVTNTQPLDATVRFVADDANPPGWLHAFDPANLTVRGNANATTSLTVFVPGSATPGAVAQLGFRVLDGFGNAAAPDLRLNVTVDAPPADETQDEPAQETPRLTASFAPTDAQAGGIAEGTLSLRSDEPGATDVTLAFRPHAWGPRLEDGIQTYTLRQGATRTIPVFVDVPSNADLGTTTRFILTATTGAHAVDAAWDVTVTSRAVDAPAQDAPTDGDDAPTDGDDAAQTPGAGTPAHALLVTLEPARFDVSPGDAASTVVRLSNTGRETLHARVQVSAGDGSWRTHADPDTLVLASGETRDLPLTVTPPTSIFPGGTSQGTVMVTTEEGLVRSAAFTMDVVPSATPPEDLTATAITKPAPQGGDHGAVTVATTTWVAAGLAAVGAGALAVARRPLREKLMWGAVGLYTRLLQPDILGHPERERLYKLVEDEPGVHFHALQRALGWNTGTLTYHVRVLERHQFIVSRRDGHYRRFYKVGAAPRKETMNADKPTDLRADVLESVRGQHGISQSDLAMALGANKQTVNYHVKVLERQGDIKIERRGRETFLYPNEPGLGPAGPVEQAQA